MNTKAVVEQAIDAVDSELRKKRKEIRQLRNNPEAKFERQIIREVLVTGPSDKKGLATWAKYLRSLKPKYAALNREVRKLTKARKSLNVVLRFLSAK